MQQHCDNCGHKNSCQDIYSKLGNSQSSSVLSKVTAAFLLPLILFIVTLAAVDKLLSEQLTNQSVRDIAAFSAGAGLVAIYLLAVKLWRIKH